ncbi:MAG TPA: hypothetical protein ENI23_11655 [bacterium]|nr:hypothetical protein [bacterium]
MDTRKLKKGIYISFQCKKCAANLISQQRTPINGVYRVANSIIDVEVTYIELEHTSAHNRWYWFDVIDKKYVCPHGEEFNKLSKSESDLYKISL